nr:hypothetical protein [Sphingobium fontiphilum]
MGLDHHSVDHLKEVDDLFAFHCYHEYRRILRVGTVRGVRRRAHQRHSALAVDDEFRERGFEILEIGEAWAQLLKQLLWPMIPAGQRRVANKTI